MSHQTVFRTAGNIFLLMRLAVTLKNSLAKGRTLLDIGGESTRPGSSPVSLDEEKRRVLPVIESIAGRLDVPISIDTTRSAIAEAAISAGAEIINDISGLRFDDKMARMAAICKAGLVLMHSRGDLEMLHSQPPVENIVSEVLKGLSASVAAAAAAGVNVEQIVVDIGLGFGKTLDQNLELLAKLDNIVDELKEYPVLVGASRKSFIGKVLNERTSSGEAWRQHSGRSYRCHSRCSDSTGSRC